MVRYLERLWGSPTITSSAAQSFPAGPPNVIRSAIRRVFRHFFPVLLETPEPMISLPSLPVSEDALTVEDVARAMRADGASIREIASKLNLSYYMARKYVTQ